MFVHPGSVHDIGHITWRPGRVSRFAVQRLCSDFGRVERILLGNLGVTCGSARERERVEDRVDEPVAVQLRDVEAGDQEYREFYDGEVKGKRQEYQRYEGEPPSPCGGDDIGHDVESTNLDPPCLRSCLRLPSVDGPAGGGCAHFHLDELRRLMPPRGRSIFIVTIRRLAATHPLPCLPPSGTAGS